MSYSLAASNIDPADIRAKLGEALDSYEEQLAANDVQLDPAADEAIHAAVAALEGLASSGIVGPGLVNVSISGHANPDHTPQPGWGRDFVSLSLTSVADQAAPVSPAGDPADDTAGGVAPDGADNLDQPTG